MRVGFILFVLIGGVFLFNGCQNGNLGGEAGYMGSCVPGYYCNASNNTYIFYLLENCSQENLTICEYGCNVLYNKCNSAPIVNVTYNGKLALVSNPTGASVWVNNLNWGETPVTKSVEAGTKDIVFYKQGYLESRRTVYVGANSYIYVHANLTLNQTVVNVTYNGTLALVSNPTGASVWVNNLNWGETPVTKSVEAGTKDIVFYKQGYLESRRTVYVGANSYIYVLANLTLNQTNVSQGPVWTECVSKIAGNDCTSVCQNKGKIYANSCTTSRGYSPWGLEAWSNAGCVGLGAGQQYDGAFALDSTTRWKCCCDSDLTKGNIQGTTTPSGTKFYVNKVAIGTTPRTATGLAPGLKTVRFTNTGYNDNVTTINVIAGQTVKVYASLSRIPSWTECVGNFSGKNCNTVCQKKGKTYSDSCTTSRGYINWGLEAWTIAGCSGTGGGQQRNGLFSLDPTIRWKCCCI